MKYVLPLRFAVTALLATPMLASAVTFDVNLTQDMPDATPGDGICSVSKTLDPKKFAVCTLRAAVVEGNRAALDKPVKVALEAGTLYRLSIPETEHAFGGKGGSLDILRRMVIAGPAGAPRATIDANLASRAFNVFNAEGTSIENINITGGFAEQGAALLSTSPMQLVNTDVRGNRWKPGVLGTGAAIYGAVSLFDSTVRFNGSTMRPLHGLTIIGVQDQVIIDSSTIDHNTGFGIKTERSAKLIVQNSTISANQRRGIDAIDTDADIAFSTISANTQSQISFITSLAHPDVALTITGSILDGNSGEPNCSVDKDYLFLTSWNLYSDASCLSDTFLDNSLHKVSGTIEPALTDAGGHTLVRVPTAGSIAIDRAPATVCEGIAVDQRGFARPVAADGVSSPRCDIGAVEVRK